MILVHDKLTKLAITYLFIQIYLFFLKLFLNEFDFPSKFSQKVKSHQPTNQSKNIQHMIETQFIHFNAIHLFGQKKTLSITLLPSIITTI